MNQILFNIKDYTVSKKYYIIIYLSILIVFCFSLYLLYNYFIRQIEHIKESNIKKVYSLSQLYINNNSNSINQINSFKFSNDISVIGLIEIPTINISYPILEECNKNLLKISVCKLTGPNPNSIGNLCIAGHNYKNNLMFSKIDTLNIDDSIFITDLSNNKIEYIVYDKYIIAPDNWSCTLQSYNSEVTLITCNNSNNKKRTVIKAKKKE